MGMIELEASDRGFEIERERERERERESVYKEEIQNLDSKIQRLWQTISKG